MCLQLLLLYLAVRGHAVQGHPVSCTVPCQGYAQDVWWNALPDKAAAVVVVASSSDLRRVCSDKHSPVLHSWTTPV